MIRAGNCRVVAGNPDLPELYVCSFSEFIEERRLQCRRDLHRYFAREEDFDTHVVGMLILKNCWTSPQRLQISAYSLSPDGSTLEIWYGEQEAENMIHHGETRTVSHLAADERIAMLCFRFIHFRDRFRITADRMSRQSMENGHDGQISDFDVERTFIEEDIRTSSGGRLLYYTRRGDGEVEVFVGVPASQYVPRQTPSIDFTSLTATVDGREVPLEQLDISPDGRITIPDGITSIATDPARPGSDMTVQYILNGRGERVPVPTRNPLLTGMTESGPAARRTSPEQANEAMSQAQRQRQILEANTELGLLRIAIQRQRTRNGQTQNDTVLLKAKRDYFTTRVNDGKAVNVRLRTSFRTSTQILIEVLPVRAGQLARVVYNGSANNGEFYVPLENPVEKVLTEHEIAQITAPSRRKSRADIL